VPIKFVTKAHMKAGPKYSLGPHKPLPENPTAPDHEPIFQIKNFPQNYITFHIHKKTAGVRKARPHNLIHISDLDPARQWCPREPTLLTLANKTRPDTFLTTAQKMVFGMGNVGADLLISMIPPEQVWGHWKCKACDGVSKFCYTPAACPHCKAKRAALRYKEVLIRDPATGIVGSVDCFVDILSNGLRTGVEIKTEGNETFKKRIKPEFDHEWRSKGYMWLMSQDPLIKSKGVNLNEMRIMYFTKEGWDYAPHIKDWPLADAGKSAVKEYWCPKDASFIDNQLDLAKSYRNWRNLHDKNGGWNLHAIPPRIKYCKSIGCAKAKSCPVRKECWGGKFDEVAP